MCLTSARWLIRDLAETPLLLIDLFGFGVILEQTNNKKTVLKNSLILVLSLIGLTLTGCGGGGDSTTQGGGSGSESAALERGIVVIGDSIGTGFGASFAFPDRLQSLTGVPVINISKGGSTAEFGAARAADLIAEHRPMWLVMLLGTNNAGGDAGGVSGAVGALRSAANVANAAGVTPVIGTLPPIKRSTKENNTAKAISDGIRGIENARIAPINSATNGSHIGSDGKHPNDSGQEIIAQLFAQQIF